MDVPAQREDTEESDAVTPETDTIITSHETRPGKVVFTERHNTDGWIATNLTVSLER